MSPDSRLLAIPACDGSAGETRLCTRPPEKHAGGLRLLFGGDFCPGPGHPVAQAWASPDENGEMPLLTSLASAADLSIVNLECPLGRGSAPAKSGPRLVASPTWANALASSGIDAVSLANNHVMDQGPTGLEATIDALTKSGLRHFGAGPTLEKSSQPLLTDVAGTAVGVFAFAEHEFGIAGAGKPGASPLVPETAVRLIAVARERCDVLVVLLHGGNEAFPLPRPGLQDTCRFFVDCGATAVVCCHSHVVGPLEWYRNAPIAYGLGNLYFPWEASTPPDGWHLGLSLIIDVGAATSVHIVPSRFTDHRQGIYPLSTGEAKDVAHLLEGLSSQVADAASLEARWAGFVSEKRRQYLSQLLGLTRPERLGLKAGVWPWWRVSRERLPDLLNVVRCESHREALLRLLEDEAARE